MSWDTAFAQPMSYTGGALTEPNAGVVTAGTHLLAYRVTDRSGFLGIFSPNTTPATPTLNTLPRCRSLRLQQDDSLDTQSGWGRMARECR